MTGYFTHTTRMSLKEETFYFGVNLLGLPLEDCHSYPCNYHLYIQKDAYEANPNFDQTAVDIIVKLALEHVGPLLEAQCQKLGIAKEDWTLEHLQNFTDDDVKNMRKANARVAEAMDEIAHTTFKENVITMAEMALAIADARGTARESLLKLKDLRDPTLAAREKATRRKSAKKPSAKKAA